MTIRVNRKIRTACRILVSGCFLCVLGLAGSFPALAVDPVSSAAECAGIGAVKQELEIANQSIKNYKELYSRKEAEVKALTVKINKLQDGFDKFQEITDRLTAEKEALVRQQTLLAAQLKQLEGQKAILEKQNSLLSNCTKESQQKSLDIAALSNLSKNQKDELSNKLRETQRELDAAVLANKEVARKNGDLQERYAELSVKVSNLEKNNAQLSREKESALERAQILSREIEETRAKLKTAQDQNKVLKETAGRVSGLEKAFSDLEKTRTEIESLKQENKKLRGAVFDVKNHEELKQEALLLRNETANLEKENKRLKEIAGKCRAQEDVSAQAQELRKKLIELEVENAKCAQVRGNSVKEQRGLQESIDKLRKELKRLEADNSDLRSASADKVDKKEYAGLQQETAMLRKELSAVKELNARLQALADKNKNAEALNDDLAKLRDSLTACQQQNAGLASSLDKARGAAVKQQELDQLRQKVSQLEKTKSQVWQAYTEKFNNQKELIDELIDLRARLGRQRVQLGKLEEENRKLKSGGPVVSGTSNKDDASELDQLRIDLARLESENARLRKAESGPAREVLLEELRQLREELAKVDAENRSLKTAQVAKVNVADKALQDEISRLQQIIVRLESENNSLRYSAKVKPSSRAKELKLLKEEIADLKESNAKLAAKLEQSDKERSLLVPLSPQASRQEGFEQGLAVGLKRELESAKEQLAVLKKQCKRLEDENVVLKQEALKAVKGAVDAGAVNQLKEKLAKVEQERNLMRVEMAQAKKHEGFVEGVKQSYEQELVKVKTELDALKSENKKCAEETARLKKFESSTQDIGEARRQIVKLTEEKRLLTQEMDALKVKQDNFVDQLVKVRKEKEALELASRGKTGDQIDKLQRDLKEAQQLSYQLVQEKAGFQSREKQLLNQIGSLESQKSQIERTIAEVNSKFDILNNEHAKLSEQLAQTVVNLSETAKEKAALEVNAENLKRDIAEIRNQLTQARDIGKRIQEEMAQLRMTNAELSSQNAKIVGQKAQETAIFDAQMDQLRAHKDGEISALNQRWAKYKKEKELEIVSINGKVSQLQQELQTAQNLSFQLMKEKTSFGTQQKQLNDEYQRVQNQNIVLSGEVKKLEEQNNFLRNQFVSVSQESNALRQQIKSSGKTPLQPEARYREELQAIKKELLRKSQQLQYCEMQSAGTDISRKTKELIDEHGKLKQKYEISQAKVRELEAVKKQYEDFKAKSNKAVEENATLHYNLSVLYAQTKDYQKAIAELEKVIEIKPNDGAAYYNMGVIYGEYLNNRKKSIGYFKKYLSLSPKDPDADRIRKYVLTYETLEQ